jgi:hypothetical protein
MSHQCVANVINYGPAVPGPISFNVVEGTGNSTGVSVLVIPSHLRFEGHIDGTGLKYPTGPTLPSQCFGNVVNVLTTSVPMYSTFSFGGAVGGDSLIIFGSHLILRGNIVDNASPLSNSITVMKPTLSGSSLVAVAAGKSKSREILLGASAAAIVLGIIFMANRMRKRSTK